MVYEQTQELSLTVHTNIRATMKLWDLHTKKLRNGSSAKLDEHNNNFGKGGSPSFQLMTGKYIYALSTLQTDLLDHPFVK